METVGQLDQDDPRVLRHREQQLAVVLDLPFRARAESHPPDLGDAIDDRAHLVAEEFADPLQGDDGVLGDVVHQRRHHRGRVQLEFRDEGGHLHGVVDEWFARGAALLRVRLRGKFVGGPDRVDVETARVHLECTGKGAGEAPDGLGACCGCRGRHVVMYGVGWGGSKRRGSPRGCPREAKQAHARDHHLIALQSYGSFSARSAP